MGIFYEKLDLVHPLFHDPGKNGIYNCHSVIWLIGAQSFFFRNSKF